MFWKKKQEDGPETKFLADLLASPAMQENLLGVQKLSPLTPDQIRAEHARVAQYASTEHYKAWAKTLWSDVARHMDALTNPSTPKDQVDFLRGQLASSLSHLRRSYEIQWSLKRTEPTAKPAVKA
jgi:hypothetical protein